MNPRLEKVDNKDKDEGDNGSSKDYGNVIESSPANTKYGIVMMITGVVLIRLK
jgi:hypothetical protein